MIALKVTLAALTCTLGNSFIVTTNGFLMAPSLLPSGQTAPRHRMLPMQKSTSLPTLEQLSADPFMKQIAHASEIVPLLDDKDMDEKNLTAILAAQLSHSDGIRGFFANYLTTEGRTAADLDVVPTALVNAMEQTDPEHMIPLACMNVVMPTAMATMHKDPDLSANAAKTAERGRRVLLSLNEVNEEVQQTCVAIYEAATGESPGSDEKAVQYWNKFFCRYDYELEQKRDIAATIKTIIA